MSYKKNDEDKKIDKVMNEFSVTPFEVVSKRLDEATKKTIKKLLKDNQEVPHNG